MGWSSVMRRSSNMGGGLVLFHASNIENISLLYQLKLLLNNAKNGAFVTLL